MRRGRPSETAIMAAFWRALAHAGATTLPAFHDPCAARLLPPGPWRTLFLALEPRIPQLASRLAPYVDLFVLRTAFLDALLKGSARQIVSLGVGLDARAWRLPALSGRVFFEVDHPDTLALRERRVASLGEPSARRIPVPLDFVRDALPEALQRAGHSPGEPTTWIWEGVVMYLDDGALRRGLQGIARASAPGSRLFLHYQEPGPSTRRIGLRRLLLRLMGEPQNGLRSRETMLRELVDAGFEVLEDLGADTQAARLHGPRPRNFRAQASRVLVAGPSPAGEACGQA